MALSDVFHALFVLLTTFAYALPMWEGVQRRSIHHTLLFAVVGVLSFVLHCEETAMCAPLKPSVHAGLTSASHTLAYYILFVMLGVVFEVRSEMLLRLVGGATCLALWAIDPHATVRNTAVTFALSLAVLAVDVVMYSKRFTPAYWKRLTVIAGMAGMGLLLLRLLSVLWVWHGIWHVYFIGATYLLLLAQRHKKMLQAKASALSAQHAGGGIGGSGALSSGTSHGTPLKRRAGPGGGGPGVGTPGNVGSVAGAAASSLDGLAGQQSQGSEDVDSRAAVV